MNHPKLFAPMLAAALLLMAPAAQAQLTADTDVPAKVNSTLAVAVQTAPSQMSLVPGLTSTSAAVLTVNSTVGWTLLARDSVGATGTTPGFMDKVDCVTGLPLIVGADSLDTALTVQADSGTARTLTGSNQSISTGTGNASKTVTLSQPVGSGELLTGDDCYAMTVTYTIQ